jgi:hypothetical protein
LLFFALFRITASWLIIKRYLAFSILRNIFWKVLPFP